jgi:hypothetical protein
VLLLGRGVSRGGGRGEGLGSYDEAPGTTITTA